ncbi:HEAT repeat domain-containing protein [Pseudomonas aeruginosa]
MPTTTAALLQRPVNHHILNQHLEEAAFCWLRRQEALWRPSYRCSHLQRLDQLLDAHLEGLRVAGPASLPNALGNLERWKTPDEVFACTYVLLQQGSGGDWTALERVVEARPAAAKGAAAALIWSPTPAAEDCLRRWSDSPIEALRAAYASAFAVTHASDAPRVHSAWLAKALADSSAAVRARALRCIGEWRLPAQAQGLLAALGGDEPQCRFESAYALAWLGMPEADAALLETLPQMQGSLQRRALLLFALTAQPDAFEAWIQQAQADPTQSRALIWSLAFRGNAAALKRLLDYLPVPLYARLAGYAIAHITGLDMDEQGLWNPEDQHAGDTPHFSEDDGLLVPDVERLTDWVTRYTASMSRGAYLLGGQDMRPDNARPLLQAGWQPQRWQAAVLLDMADRRQQLFSRVPSPLL